MNHQDEILHVLKELAIALKVTRALEGVSFNACVAKALEQADHVLYKDHMRKTTPRIWPKKHINNTYV